jgi:hypothetical protein
MHRDLPRPPLRATPRALRYGRGSLLCMTGISLHQRPMRGRDWTRKGGRNWKRFDIVIGREPHLLGQSFLPIALQRPRHQPVLRFGAGVTATRLINLVLRAFQTLTPLLIQGCTLGCRSAATARLASNATRLRKVRNPCANDRLWNDTVHKCFSVWRERVAQRQRKAALSPTHLYVTRCGQTPGVQTPTSDSGCGWRQRFRYPGGHRSESAPRRR